MAGIMIRDNKREKHAKKGHGPAQQKSSNLAGMHVNLGQSRQINKENGLTKQPLAEILK